VLVRLCDLLIPFNFVVPGQTQNTLLSFRKLIHDWPDLKKLAPELQAGLHLEDHDRREADRNQANEFSGESYKVLNFVVDLPVHLPERAIQPGDGRIAFCMVELQFVDQGTAQANEKGENAHQRYKKRQLLKVLRRLSRGLVVPKRKPAQK